MSVECGGMSAGRVGRPVGQGDRDEPVTERALEEREALPRREAVTLEAQPEHG